MSPGLDPSDKLSRVQPDTGAGGARDGSRVHAPIVGTPPLAAAAPSVLELAWPDEQATAAWCGRVAARMLGQPALRHGFITLSGDLGAGKTTLVRHLLRALGVSGRVKSPTYALVEPYELTLTDGDTGPQPWPLWHFDFYRLDSPREVEEAGLLDVLTGPGLKLAEWPEKAVGALPVPDLAITLRSEADEQRRVWLQAHSTVGLAWVA